SVITRRGTEREPAARGRKPAAPARQADVTRTQPSGRQAQAEGVSRGVEVDAEAAGGGGLVLVDGRAEGECPGLGAVDVGDGEVEVELLGVVAVGPGGAAEVRHLLEGEGGLAVGVVLAATAA